MSKTDDVPTRIDVDVRAALHLRRHVTECVVCRMHDRPACSEGTHMVEDALSMAGLFDRARTAEETAAMLKDGTITLTGDFDFKATHDGV